VSYEVTLDGVTVKAADVVEALEVAADLIEAVELQIGSRATLDLELGGEDDIAITCRRQGVSSKGGRGSVKSVEYD
jgi:hypothetical protein